MCEPFVPGEGLVLRIMNDEGDAGAVRTRKAAACCGCDVVTGPF